MSDRPAPNPILSTTPRKSESATDTARRQASWAALRDDLQRRIADQEREAQQVRTLEAWAETVAANLDALTYDERRTALDAWEVTVRILVPMPLMRREGRCLAG